jgi:hypothetical protein
VERSPFTTASSYRTLSSIAVLIAIGVAAYILRYEIVDVFSPPPPPEAEAIIEAVDSAFARIELLDRSTSTLQIEDHEIPRDRLVLAGDPAVLRANLEITRAVERAGGTILYGVESIDSKRRWQTVTLGVSAGDSLIREVMLVCRVR